MRGREIKRLNQARIREERKAGAKTARVNETYDHIVRIYDDTGRSPTTRELASLVGCSLSTCHEILKQLQDDGRLITNPGNRPGFNIPNRRKWDGADAGS